MFATKEEIKEMLQKIKEEAPIIVVEGKKDRAALEAFQIKNIIILNGKDIWNRIEQTVEETGKNTRSKQEKVF